MSWAGEEWPTVVCRFVGGAADGLQPVILLGGLPDCILLPVDDARIIYDRYELEPISEQYYYVSTGPR
jgi:hypothetical protein